MVGDFNSRTKNLDDTICKEKHDHQFVESFYSKITTKRCNQDQNENGYGPKLVEFCISSGLYIANGRTLGDFQGKLTCHKWNGSSTVDYAITDLDLNSLRAFTVKEQTPLSDHSQIILYLKRADTGNIRSQPCNLYNIKRKYRWSQNSLEQYQDAMVSESTQALLDSFLAQTYPQNTEGIEWCLIHINQIFDHLASSANLKCKTKQPKKTNTRRWFDSDCKSTSKTLRNISNQKHRNPDTPP